MKFPNCTKEREKKETRGIQWFKGNLVRVLEPEFVKPKCMTAQLASYFGRNSTIILLGCKQ